MNLIRSAAAGRVVAAGPRLLLLSPPSLRGLATLMAFLEGRITVPEGAPPGWLPGLAGDDAFAEYATPMGLALLLHVTTRRDDPGLTLDEAAGLSAEMDGGAIAALIQVAFIRQRGVPEGRAGRSGGIGDGRPRGLESFDFGPIFESESLRRFPPQVLAEMSVDQFENALFAGRIEPEDALSFDEVMAIYRQHCHAPEEG